MTKKGEMDAPIYMAQISTIFTCFYVSIQRAETEKEKNNILIEAVETLKEFEKKLEKCNGL
jgi:hypothetical protein